ncbi:B-cell receptor CD22-like [Periophthalmus magnuspinnatus]|uniref:B-cell receptor CD22-like n=1 Tax=Periophthalmus magnuspinnatus TaxID=409849 RepID=UPI002436B3A8|nr:B-cell receptor CD22-like [Periophthalmus magnuspinnatus]
MLIQIIQLLLLCSGADSCDLPNYLSIKTPSPMEALSGSCLWIPCTYKVLPLNKDINTADPVTGIWFKGDRGYSTDSQNTFSVSGDSSKSYPMNFTGNLKNKNCTTMFYNLNKSHNDKYYFRVENSGFKATARCDSLQIKVRDSPWSPTIEVSGKQTETEVVTITCSAVTPCPHAPPQLTWDLHQGTAHITETNGTFTTKITQNITLTDAHDGLMIKCNAAYPVSEGSKMANSNVTLSVSYGPKNTSVEVSPSGSLSAGQSVTLSCSSRAKPPVHHFTWFRHSSQGPANVSQGHTYSFNLTEEGQYYCVASNTLGNDSSPSVIILQSNTDFTFLSPRTSPLPILLRVVGPHEDGPTSGGQASPHGAPPPGEHPPQAWLQGGAPVTPVQATSDSPWSPTIEVSGKQTETEVVTITCSAVTPCPHAPPQLTWDLHQGTAHITETNGTFTTKITQNITLTDAHDGLMIKCNAAYPVTGGFKMADSNVTLSVSYGPKNTSVEVSPSGSLSAGQSVTLSCSSRAKPPVHHFTWFRHSSQGPANVSQGHTYSFNLTEEGQYYCVASNTLGQESSPAVTLNITGMSP